MQPAVYAHHTIMYSIPRFEQLYVLYCLIMAEHSLHNLLPTLDISRSANESANYAHYRIMHSISGTKLMGGKCPLSVCAGTLALCIKHHTHPINLIIFQQINEFEGIRNTT
jgi:hypothetical protein